MENVKQRVAYEHLGFVLKGMLAPTVTWYAGLDKLEEVATTQPCTNRHYLQELMANAERLKATFTQLTNVLDAELPSLFVGNPTLQQLNMVAADIAARAHELQLWEMANLQWMPTATRLQPCRAELRGSTHHTILELDRLADHVKNHWDEAIDMPAPFELNLDLSADLDRIYQLLESMETVPETDEVVERKKSRGLMQTIGSLLMLEYFWRRGD